MSAHVAWVKSRVFHTPTGTNAQIYTEINVRGAAHAWVPLTPRTPFPRCFYPLENIPELFGWFCPRRTELRSLGFAAFFFFFLIYIYMIFLAFIPSADLVGIFPARSPLCAGVPPAPLHPTDLSFFFFFLENTFLTRSGFRGVGGRERATVLRAQELTRKTGELPKSAFLAPTHSQSLEFGCWVFLYFFW